MPSAFFKVLGTVSHRRIRRQTALLSQTQIFSTVVILLWLTVSTLTLRKVFSGEIFVAPCLGEQIKTCQAPEAAEVEKGLPPSEEASPD